MDTTAPYLSESRETSLKDPYLVQRISFKKWKLEFDSMWSSEFERGVVPGCLDAMLTLRNNEKLAKKTFVLDFSPNVLIDIWTEVEVVCNWEDFEEIKNQIIWLLQEKYSLKEDMQLDYVHSDDNTNFLCLKNNYFFSLDWNWTNFIAHIDMRESKKIQKTQEKEIQEATNPQVKVIQKEILSTQEQLPGSKKQNTLSLEEIWIKTIDNIKQLYTSWIPLDWNWDPKHHFSWYRPYHLNINFHNNLYKIGFKCKELNEYVDPKTYKRATNEILIWEPENNWASVWIWPLNYSGIKQDCFDMEKLAGVKMISNWNQSSPRSILNNHYLQRIFDWKFWKDKISWSFICDIYNIISFNENNIPTEEEFESVQDFLIEKNLEEIIFQYLSQNFPWERTAEEYEETAREAVDILLLKITFYNVAISRLDKNLSFEDCMKKVERIWYKNRNTLEKIRGSLEMQGETQRLLTAKKTSEWVVNENKEKLEYLL